MKWVWIFGSLSRFAFLSEDYRLVTKWTACSEDILELWLRVGDEYAGWDFVLTLTAECRYVVLGRLHASGHLKEKNVRSFRHTLTQLLECQEFVSSWLAVVYIREDCQVYIAVFNCDVAGLLVAEGSLEMGVCSLELTSCSCEISFCIVLHILVLECFKLWSTLA